MRDVRVVVANNVRIENPPAEVAHALIYKYTVANPEYARLERLGKWTGNTPKTLALWERDGTALILPRGAMREVCSALRNPLALYNVEIVHEESEGDSEHNFQANINLYEYQEKAVQAALEAAGGVLVAPCGSGKTQMGLAIAAALKCRTLWLTHTHELLNQSMSRAKQLFDLPASAFGTITAGKVELGEVITFATVQTMVKLDLQKYRDTWGCVIVDEAHHVAGTPTKLMQFGKVIGSLNARYKFGLTATPKRADGLTACMYAYLGPKVYEISREDVGDRVCPVKYKFVDTGWDCDIDEVINPDGTLNYVELINKVCADKDRNFEMAAIAYKIKFGLGRFDNRNAKFLFLTDRVNHANSLFSMLAQFGILTVVLTGQAKKEAREKAISMLREGKISGIVATYSLAKEGLDIPELTHLVLASPNKTDTVITQAAGRVARACEGKEYGVIIDFNDDLMPLQTWARKRERIYKKLGYMPL